MRAHLALGLAMSVLAAAGSPRTALADEPPPLPVEERAFVEVFASASGVYVGQEVLVSLRVGYDGAWFREHAVPLFRRELGAPLDVTAPWLLGIAGTQEIEVLEQPQKGLLGPVRFAANGGVLDVPGGRREDRGGRSFALLVVDRRLRTTTPGTIAIAAPTLRFAYATRFETDLVGSRVAIDRKDVVVTGKEVSVRVDALPEAGRPKDFSGAVGRFTITANADRARLRAGESVRLSIRFAGNGLLVDRLPMRLEGVAGFEGWHVLSATTRDDSTGTHEETFELVPTASGSVAIPAVPFAFFDPTPPGAYRVARSEPIAIRVEGVPEAAAPNRAAGKASEGRGGSPWTWIGSVLLAAALGLLARRLLRRAGPARTDQEPTAAAAARVEAATEAGEDLSDPFAAFLAARLGCAPAAVVGPDVAARLVASGVPADRAARAAATLASLVAARYGGPPPPDAATVRAIVEALSPPT